MARYEYKKKTVDRKDKQAQFVLPLDAWESFKDNCKDRGTTPSEVLRYAVEMFNERKKI